MTFLSLKPVIEAIVDAAATICSGFRPRMEYKTKPTQDVVMVYDKESGSSKPDGYFVCSGLSERVETRPYWHEIAVSGEYGLEDVKNSTEMLKNRQQTCWNMYQQLRQDPRRRFALAFTIDRTTTRLWFCNRSEVFVSTPFDFFSANYATFVQFVLRIVAAEDHQLGWDTSMVQRPLKDADTPFTPANLMYDMEVHGPKGGIYRTTKLLNDVGARAIRGRGTRVWEVKKVQQMGDDQEPSGPAVALKDAWVHSDRTREAVILDGMRALGKKGNKMFQYVVKNNLLTVECYGDVLINGAPDHTRDLHTKGVCRTPATKPLLRIPLVSTATLGDVTSGRNNVSKKERARLAATTPPATSQTQKRTQFHEKQHERTVFTEVAASLHDHNKPQDVFRALAQIVVALQQIHVAGNGWVHRDISAGNILLTPAPDQVAKLADLEYMKELTDHNSHEVRTGTLNFLACEADERSYRYYDPPEEEQPLTKRARLQSSSDGGEEEEEEMDDENVDDQSSAQLNIVLALRGLLPDSEPATVQQHTPRASRDDSLTFFHNALHDLESILWIALYFLFDKEPISQQGPTAVSWDRGEQRKMAAKLFYTKDARVIAMTATEDWAKYVKVLHPAFRPAAEFLGDIRWSLIKRYQEVEAEYPMDIKKTAGVPLYGKFVEKLSDAARVIGDVVVRDLSHITLIEE